MGEKKILIICPASRDIITFRASLIMKFQTEGYEVSAIAFDSEYEKELNGLNVRLIVINDDNRGLNPFKILTLKNKYVKAIKSDMHPKS